MIGYLCLGHHFHVAHHANDPCPTCSRPARMQLEDLSRGPQVQPTGQTERVWVNDATGQPTPMLVEQVEPERGSAWQTCTDPVWWFDRSSFGSGYQLQFLRLPQELMAQIRASVCNNWTDSEDYRRNRQANPFLQGEDVASGWTLVEFTVIDPEACQPVVEHLIGLVQGYLSQPPSAPSRKVGP